MRVTSDNILQVVYSKYSYSVDTYYEYLAPGVLSVPIYVTHRQLRISVALHLLNSLIGLHYPLKFSNPSLLLSA
jgi:hypothetical protein